MYRSVEDPANPSGPVLVPYVDPPRGIVLDSKDCITPFLRGGRYFKSVDGTIYTTVIRVGTDGDEEEGLMACDEVHIQPYGELRPLVYRDA